MNEPAQSAPDRSESKAHFLAKVHRYRNLLRKKWWVLVLTAAAGLGAEAILSCFDVPAYVSYGRMIVSIKLAIPEGSVYNEEMSKFMETQTALMQSQLVVNRARVRVAALRPDLAGQPQAANLRVGTVGKTTIFGLQATGSDKEYTQAFLQACMDEYISLKKEMRAQTSDTTVAGLTEQALRLEKELRKCDDELVAFQGSNTVMALQDQGSSASMLLNNMMQNLLNKKADYELLQQLTLDENIQLEKEKAAAVPIPAPSTAAAAAASDDKNKAASAAPAPATEPSTEYLKAKQDLLMAKAELQEMSQYMRPKHPKIIAKKEDITHKEQLLDLLKTQSAEQMEIKKNSLGLQIKTLEHELQEQQNVVLEINRKTAEYQRLKGNQQRVQTLYDKLLATMQSLDVNKEVSPESVTIMEKPSPAMADHPALSRKLLTGLVIGFGAGLIILFFVDRLDDRLNTFTELQDVFDEPVLGQIPREKASAGAKDIQLITPDDARHSFVEAYRNLRSSLLYMGETQRPRTLLLTSSVPNEGKSLTSANLAITMANAGSKVLLVDADLRKGVLHSRFGTPAEPGFSEALSKGLNWSEAVQPTQVPNLFLLPRGAVTHKSSEFFIGEVTTRFLKDAAASYDFVMLDTAPVMAADDVTSLAPLVDGAVFVIRAEHTSARVARAALELLYQRQVNILGLIFNAVRPSGADYYYYYKYKDYYKSYPSGTVAKPAAVKHET